MMELMRDLTGPGGSRELYLQSIEKLGGLYPDLWLPAVPVHGQNANLYDRDWEKVLEMNRP
jgi:hypothetical protein